MNSVRWTAISNMVTRLRTITPAGGYTFDLSSAAAVDSGLEGREQRLEGTTQVHVQVSEGDELHERQEISPGTLRTATLELKLDLMLRGQTTTAMRQRLNQLLADVNKCVHSDPTLQAAVSRLWVAAVDEPHFSQEQRACWCLVHVAVEYHYLAGQTI